MVVQMGDTGADMGTQTDDALGLIIRRAPAVVSEAIQACAVPRWFDAALIAALRDDPTDAGRIFNRLQRYSFVESVGQGRLAFHDGVREDLARRLEADPQRLMLWHRRAYDEFGKRLAEKPDDRGLRLEQIYHQLAFDPEGALNRVEDLFYRSEQIFELETGEALLRLLEAQSGPVYDDWARYYRARLNFDYGRYQEAGLGVEQLLAREAELEPGLRAHVRNINGDVQLVLRNWRAAVDAYSLSYKYFLEMGDSVRSTAIALKTADVYANFFLLAQDPYTLTAGSDYLASTLRFLRYVAGLLYALIFSWLLSDNPFGRGPKSFSPYEVEHLYNACKWYRRAGQSARDSQMENEIKLAISELLANSGNGTEAGRLVEEVARSEEGLINPYRQARLQLQRADLHLNQGQLSMAEEDAEGAAGTFQKYGDQRNYALARATRARARRAAGFQSKALEDFQAAVAILRALDDRLALGKIYQHVARYPDLLNQMIEIGQDDRLYVSPGRKPFYKKILDWLKIGVLLGLFLFVLPPLVGHLPTVVGFLAAAVFGAIVVWIPDLIFVPIVTLLFPFETLAEHRLTTFILYNNSRIGEVRLDGSEIETISWFDIKKAIIHVEKWWNKPRRGRSWLAVEAPDSMRIRVNMEDRKGFFELWESAKKNLAGREVELEEDISSILQDSRTYIMIVFFLLAVFGVMALISELSPENVGQEDEFQLLFTEAVIVFSATIFLIAWLYPRIAKNFKQYSGGHQFGTVLAALVLAAINVYFIIQAWEFALFLGGVMAMVWAGAGILIGLVKFIVNHLAGQEEGGD